LIWYTIKVDLLHMFLGANFGSIDFQFSPCVEFFYYKYYFKISTFLTTFQNHVFSFIFVCIRFLSYLYYFFELIKYPSGSRINTSFLIFQGNTLILIFLPVFIFSFIFPKFLLILIYALFLLLKLHFTLIPLKCQTVFRLIIISFLVDLCCFLCVDVIIFIWFVRLNMCLLVFFSSSWTKTTSTSWRRRTTSKFKIEKPWSV